MYLFSLDGWDSARSTAGEVPALAEKRKCIKYNSLSVTHSFTPVTIETSGAIGTNSLEVLKELGRRVR